LAQALEMGSENARLVVAADCRRAKPGSTQELTYGVGAAAVLTGGHDVLARYLVSHSAAAPFVDHFRESGEKYDYYWEERWIRDAGVAPIVPAAVAQLLTRINVPAARVAWFGLAGVPVGSDVMVAKTLGIPAGCVVPDLQGTVGDAGAAHSLLLLASTIERGKRDDVSSRVGLTLRDLSCHLEKAGIARQKFPERLELVEEMPRTAAGKIKKDVLRGIAARLVAETPRIH